MKKLYLFPILAFPAILGLAAYGEGDKADATNSGAGAAAGSTDGGRGVPYTTELPPEMIQGTPVPIKLPNLEPALTTAPVFNIPAGTLLLSLGKPVTSSDDFPLIGSLDLITNGVKSAGEAHCVELAAGKQWVQIDLEQKATIHAIHVWHYHSQRRAYKGVVAQISNDPRFKEGVTTVFNNDYEDTHGLGKGADRPYVETRFGKIIDGRGTTGRYVRLYSAGNTSNDNNHCIEVEVHGIPAS